MPRPERELCARCGAPILWARFAAFDEPVSLALDADPIADGRLWIDEAGSIHAVEHYYRDGEPRYAAHALACSERYEGASS